MKKLDKPITIHGDDVPTSKVSVNGPMRDQIWFKSEAKIRKVHEPAKVVPNSGFVSETKEMFNLPSDVKAKEARICPIDTPYLLPGKIFFLKNYRTVFKC